MPRQHSRPQIKTRRRNRLQGKIRQHNRLQARIWQRNRLQARVRWHNRLRLRLDRRSCAARAAERSYHAPHLSALAVAILLVLLHSQARRKVQQAALGLQARAIHRLPAISRMRLLFLFLRVFRRRKLQINLSGQGNLRSKGRGRRLLRLPQRSRASNCFRLLLNLSLPCSLHNHKRSLWDHRQILIIALSHLCRPRQ